MGLNWFLKVCVPRNRRPVLSLIARRDRHLHVAAMAEGSYDAVAIEGDCDLSFVCRGSLCSSLGGVGFARMWSGGRANRGLCGRTGKYVFEVRVERGLNVSREDAGAASADSADVHLCRVGWSTTASPTHTLGETKDGWGFGGTGTTDMHTCMSYCDYHIDRICIFSLLFTHSHTHTQTNTHTRTHTNTNTKTRT